MVSLVRAIHAKAASNHRMSTGYIFEQSDIELKREKTRMAGVLCLHSDYMIQS